MSLPKRNILLSNWAAGSRFWAVHICSNVLIRYLLLRLKGCAHVMTFPLWCRHFFRTLMAPKTTAYACTSLVLADYKILSILAKDRPAFYSRILPLKGKTILGWGRKYSGKRAIALAQNYGLGCYLVEDGFLRSVKRTAPALSIVLDSKGIYYDCTEPSALESLVENKLSKAEIARVHCLITDWRAVKVSKFNSERDFLEPLPNSYILICDQTLGDASIEYGGANAQSFAQMLEAALAEYPNHQIILKTHPDTVTRGKKTHFDLDALKSNSRIKIISDPVHPVRLIEHADAVYTVTSQVGFEALIWGKRVRCFGMPFYAGWGLTEDELPAPERRGKASLEQLVHAALVEYPKYVDPVTDQLCEVERAMDFVRLQRRLRLEIPEQIHAVGFSHWKKPFVRDFLQGSKLQFSKKISPQLIYSNEPLVLWGAKYAKETRDRSNIYRIEDGFLRSCGLGADLVRPVSIVVDQVGVYFDSTKPSQLENFLDQHTFSDSETKRAARLRDKIVNLELTKYNVDKGAWSKPTSINKVILVVGQVESDASIEYGSPALKSNYELLKHVRQENPNDYIVYKPHPDVIAKIRKSGISENNIEKLCDEVVGNVEVSSLFSQVDELHTMTSLMGFEALLRGVKVVCHGLPFYAGWGLTQDKISCERRTRRLTIEQLIYGALVEYPRYLHPDKPIFIEPETAVEFLAKSKQDGIQTRSYYRKMIRMFALIYANLRKDDRP